MSHPHAIRDERAWSFPAAWHCDWDQSIGLDVTLGWETSQELHVMVICPVKSPMSVTSRNIQNTCVVFPWKPLFTSFFYCIDKKRHPIISLDNFASGGTARRADSPAALASWCSMLFLGSGGGSTRACLSASGISSPLSKSNCSPSSSSSSFVPTAFGSCSRAVQKDRLLVVCS